MVKGAYIRLLWGASLLAVGGCELLAGLGGEVPYPADGGTSGTGGTGGSTGSSTSTGTGAGNPSCTNNTKDGDETDTDCGGATCDACGDGMSCLQATDCSSVTCKQNTCVPSISWANSYGDAEEQLVSDLMVDTADNTVIAGSFMGTIDFEDGTPHTGAGGYDAFVAKFNSAGTALWSKSFSGSGDQKALDVSADDSGNVAVVGAFQNSISIGQTTLSSSGDFDIFVAKFSAIGNQLWAYSFGDPGAQLAYGVTQDGMGNVLIVGGIQGSVNFGGGALNSAGQTDAFVLKLDTSGNWWWNKMWGDAGNQYASGVAADSAKDFVVVGSFEGTVDFGPGAASSLTSKGGYDVFVVKFDSLDNPLWSRQIAGDQNQLDPRVAVTPSGDIVVAGAFPGTLDFGGMPPTILSSQGSSDIFVAKMDAVGNLMWAKRFGDDKSQTNVHVTVDPDGNIGLTGAFQGTIDLGITVLKSQGGNDMFAAKLDKLGNVVWARSIGDAQGQQLGAGIGFNTKDNLIVGGMFSSMFPLDAKTFISQGNTDIFLMEFNIP